MRINFKLIIPYITFIGTALIVLFFDFGWVYPLSEKDGAIYDLFPQGIYIMPILWLVIMCFPIAWIIFNEKKFHLPQEPPTRRLSTFIFAFTSLFVLILFFRTLIIWKYNGPYEKMSMIFFLLFQILLVEQVSLEYYGLKARAPWEEWKKDLKYIGYLMLVALILIAPILVITVIILYPQVQQAAPQIIAPNFYILISFPFQTIAVGISEELMFRGYLHENLKEFDKKSDKKSHFYALILLNSFIFGCFHIPWYIVYSPTTFFAIPEENIIPMITRIISTGAFGFFMCLIYEYTGSLRITILIHGLWNTLGAFLGSAFMFVDLSIFNAISFAQIMLLGITLLVPFIIGVVLLLKTPKFLAKKLKFQEVK